MVQYKRLYFSIIKFLFNALISNIRTWNSYIIITMSQTAELLFDRSIFLRINSLKKRKVNVSKFVVPTTLVYLWSSTALTYFESCQSTLASRLSHYVLESNFITPKASKVQKLRAIKSRSARCTDTEQVEIIWLPSTKGFTDRWNDYKSVLQRVSTKRYKNSLMKTCPSFTIP